MKSHFFSICLFRKTVILQLLLMLMVLLVIVSRRPLKVHQISSFDLVIFRLPLKVTISALIFNISRVRFLDNGVLFSLDRGNFASSVCNANTGAGPFVITTSNNTASITEFARLSYHLKEMPLLDQATLING